ncbi:MAG TPA: helicase HerA-like domain-containing protein, partial [Kofleriaceae bacterium]|nr:helicase HerA-like domain-containing protein [Kofleriaceae bacterium]
MSATTKEPSLWLGTRRDDGGGAVALPARALLRHAIALGSSGSGKTVFCKVVVEEAIRLGVPVIAIDPQGDLASLALGPVADDELARHGGDVTIAAELRERADVVVFTPASHKGVALCADPVDADVARLAAEDRPQSVTRSASRIVALLGYDLDSDEGAGV